MERRCKPTRLFVSALLGACVLGFTACGNDDDAHTSREAWGDFAGKMYVTPVATAPLGRAAQAGTDVVAMVKNDTVYFNDFPVKDLVTAIVGAAGADQIVQAIGKVKYKVGYKATLSARQDSLYLMTDPKPLELVVPTSPTTGMPVKVVISAKAKGSYDFSGKNLKFDLRAEKVLVNGADFPAFPESVFKFELKKTN